MSSPADTVLAFIRAINGHEIGTITGLLAPDHEFIDALGAAVRGRDEMRRAWIAYFFMIPDYAIEVTQIFSREGSVVITGKASGTVAAGTALPPENRWEIPIAALAEVADGVIRRWQVFADNEPVRKILNRT